ncbi:MAG: sigma factor [Clostridia bacterium]
MEGLETWVPLAAKSTTEMDALLRAYLPFLKKQARDAAPMLNHDDRLSLAMLAFAGAVKQYAPERGAFLPFAAACIRNRLTDEVRKEARHNLRTVPFPQGNAEPSALPEYDKEQERQALAEEIKRYGAALAPYGLTFGMLEASCPKKRRARARCLDLARWVAENEAQRAAFLRTSRLPQGELARCGNVSIKTVEKQRKYIVALVVLLLGDFPDMLAFLPREAE